MKNLLRFSSLCLLLSFAPTQLPEVNQKIITYCKEHLNKKVGRGECWDLADAALNYAGAKWESPYNFGKKYDFKKEEVLVGDIVQFENVVFKSPQRVSEMSHHTAIIWEVKPEKVFVLIHQNINKSKKVQLTEEDFKTIKKGKAQFYRPQ